MRTISLKLPDNLLVQLDNEAKARRVTKSWLIRESLENALRKPSPGGADSSQTSTGSSHRRVTCPHGFWNSQAMHKGVGQMLNAINVAKARAREP